MQEIGQRIVIVGITGSGKSTLATQLATHYDLHRIELDNLFWQSNWEESPDDEFAEKVKQELLISDAWVVDGNYTRVAAPIIWEQADTLIWLDYPLRVNFWRLWKRTWARFLRRDALWEAGNKENLWKHFLTRDSLFYYAWTSYPKKKQQYTDVFSSSDYAHLRRIQLTSPQQTDQWLDSLMNDKR